MGVTKEHVVWYKEGKISISVGHSLIIECFDDDGWFPQMTYKIDLQDLRDLKFVVDEALEYASLFGHEFEIDDDEEEEENHISSNKELPTRKPSEKVNISN